MHLAEKPYLKHRNINRYLKRLSEILAEKGLGEHSILIVGGAAICLKHKTGRMTVDIDICLKKHNGLYKSCLLVAQEYKIPEDWINADVMHSESYSPILFKNAELHKTYNGILNVYIASDLDLFCMKLVAFRPKDIEDLKRLSKTLKKKKITYAMVVDELKLLYGTLYLVQGKLGYAHKLLA